ncbi:MAG: Rieske (2Fe-2S) protein [Caldilineaceae bacterium]|nr:Rieske (2Fe-2S) protein [Caldilineaceae bacterium]
MTEIRNYTHVAALADVEKIGVHTVQVGGHVLALYLHEGNVYAVDNRCPHMGFPLDRGSVHGGILTCHWHHARFDLCTGGAFDLWADDVPSYPVDVRDGAIYVDIRPRHDPIAHQRQRLADGLERNLSLVIAKAVIALIDEADDAATPFQSGLDFGTRYRMEGWGQGLTILTAMMNLLPSLRREDRARALYHGLSAVANDTAGHPPRFLVQPLPGDDHDLSTLKRWFRQFIEVRDSEGAERCIVSAIRAGATPAQMADMLFAAVTDHRYIDVGHMLDFTNKAFESLDIVGWDHAAQVLTSLVPGYANASRMEESNAWRHPIDLVKILHTSFARIPDVLARASSAGQTWQGRATLTPILLGDDPQRIADALLAALGDGASPVDLAGVVAYAAALRIARFHTSNEFGDWDTALHTFTFANAVHAGLGRLEGLDLSAGDYPLLLRGVFDGAMSIYLDRFLNIPAARLPEAGANGHTPSALPALNPLLDQQQQVNPAGQAVAGYLFHGGDASAIRAELGHLLLREDRNFHTIQSVEAAFRQHDLLGDSTEGIHVLVAAARYLAAHAPTMRAQGQTYGIARRLHRGERLFEG